MGGLVTRVIVVNAPSKTFNLGLALLNSHLVIPNPKLRQRYDAQIGRFSQTEISVLGQVAGQTAYESGAAWFRPDFGNRP
ncbi:hypothetical protein [Lactiplantibacillus plantarum]|uniref:hypothetical protein n=1 Tax=Lactiplantibacillus plantarum TaxID=1590 RepID=UPI003B9F2B08